MTEPAMTIHEAARRGDEGRRGGCLSFERPTPERTLRGQRWIVAAAAGVLVLLALAFPQAVAAAQAPHGPAVAPLAPLFNVGIGLREGRLVPLEETARIEWRDERSREVFEHCQLSEAALQRELLEYLQRKFAARPKLLEELTQSRSDPVHAAALQALVASDKATGKLFQGDGGPPLPLLEVGVQVGRWQGRLEQLSPGLASGLKSLADVMSSIYELDATLADGPLLPRDDESGLALAQQGTLSFALSPPLDRAHVLPTANEAQWQPLLSHLSAIVQRRVCRLWFRPPLVEPLQDFLADRGLPTTAVLTARDQRDGAALGASSMAEPQYANVRTERPIWTAIAERYFVGAGRVLLEPDPGLSTVYLRGEPSDVMQALYLLLPSSDYDRIRGRPGDYLCSTSTASWSAESPRPAVQLPLDDAMSGIRGSTLAIAGQQLTTSQLADLAKRLADIGYGARLHKFHRVVGELQPDKNPMMHRAWLIVEPINSQARGATMPDVSCCVTARDVPPITCPVLSGASDTKQEMANTPCTFKADSVALSDEGISQPSLLERRRRVPRNHLQVGALWPVGKPLRWTGEFRRDGLLQGDDLRVGFGQQHEALGEVAYSHDFVGFPAVWRRLRVTGRVFSQFTPERAVDASLPDERREGTEVRGLLDLWRGQGDDFAQADFGVARSRLVLKGGGSAPYGVMSTLADVNVMLVQTRPRTPGNLRIEMEWGLARGRVDGAGYGRQQFEAVAQAMFREYERGSVRLQWGRLTGAAPLAEYLPFGGSDSVRGYREERATGRRVYSAQFEYARPLPWKPTDAGLARFVRGSLGMALFADVGGVKDSPTGFDGRRSAAGVGLRWRYGELVTLRLDAARPLGHLAAADRGVRLQFGVVALRAL